MIKFSYDASEYKFKELVQQVFKVNDLSKLHSEREDLLPTKKLVFETESRTNFHEAFYKNLNSGWPEFEEAYTNFIINEVGKLVPYNFVYQYMPSFRVHLPYDKAIHKWHYDSDEDHLHPDWEINFQIAVTDVYDTNATWVETVPGLQNYKPMEMKYGEYFVFNGNKCTHGNKDNQTDSTRVSFDFRIVPIHKFKERAVESVTKGNKFVIGGYYRLFER